MILEEMMQTVRSRTHCQKDPLIEQELTSAQSDIWNRLVTSDDSLLQISNTQLTLAAQTSEYDLGAALAVADSVVLVAIKFLGVKFTSSQKFIPVRWINPSDERFIAADQANPATTWPVYCASENLTEVRFAPPLPSGTVIRCDYIYMPSALALATNTFCELPEMVHQAIVDKATAQIFTTQDDTRDVIWEGRSQAKFIAAQNSVNRRQYQQQPRTRSSRTGLRSSY